jgi:AbrB family looped-hinge helix DNA binding protein
MISKTIKVTDKGQISLPVDIRELIGISKGDELLIIGDNGKILIEKAENIAQKVMDDFSDIKALAQSSLTQVWDNDSDDIYNEYMKDGY